MLFWLFIAGTICLLLTAFGPPTAIIGLALLLILQILEGIPILLVSLVEHKSGTGLWGLGQVFYILGLINSISLLSVVGILITGGMAYTAWFVVIILILFKSAAEIEGRKAP